MQERKNSEKDDLEYLNDLNLTPTEKEAIRELNSVMSFEKGTVLLRAGQYISNSYYVLEGCMRQYYEKDGEEYTIDFFTEGQDVFTGASSAEHRQSKYYLECLEACKLNVVSTEQEENLYKLFPRFEAMCRKSAEKNIMEYQDKFTLYMSSTPEERYLSIIENRPSLLSRVPQYQLASYLGIKPESLSRIRKRMSDRK